MNRQFAGRLLGRRLSICAMLAALLVGAQPAAAAASREQVCAYATGVGVVVECGSEDESGGNDFILYLCQNDAWVEVGRQPSVGEGNNIYRFIVPSLHAGDTCNLRVRDDEGQFFFYYNLKVGNFATQAVAMQKDGLWLTWESLPDRDYVVWQIDRLSGTWQQGPTVTAVDTRTRVFVATDANKRNLFFQIVMQSY